MTRFYSHPGLNSSDKLAWEWKEKLLLTYGGNMSKVEPGQDSRWTKRERRELILVKVFDHIYAHI